MLIPALELAKLASFWLIGCAIHDGMMRKQHETLMEFLCIISPFNCNMNWIISIILLTLLTKRYNLDFFHHFFDSFCDTSEAFDIQNPTSPIIWQKSHLFINLCFFYKICFATTTTVAKMIDRTNYFQLNYPNDNLIALEMMSKQQTQPSSSSMFKKQGLQESGFKLPSNTFFEKNI